MNYFKSGATGVAAAVVIAIVATLVPGAQATPQPRSSAVDPANGVRQVAGQAAAASPQGSVTSRLRGTFGRAGTVRGTFDPKRFTVKHGNAYATGIVHATLRRGDGTLVGTTNKQVTLLLRDNQAAKSAELGRNCRILDLVLGPLDLDLLGLRVHLNRVVLHIVAASGAGALLGNLLCAVAGLLDSTGLLELLRLSNALNRILSILRV